jgi:thiamine-phosphate pyrophosphorylase
VLEAARRIAALAAGRALLIINDRADLTLLSGADGVHLGDEDLPVVEARRLLGPDLLVGRTVRNAAEAARALAEGADHLGFGPVFPSATKPLAFPATGIEGLAAACAAIPAPVVAISGIGLSTSGAVAGAGAACAAVIGELFAPGPEPVRERAARLVEAFEGGRAGRAGAAGRPR